MAPILGFSALLLVFSISIFLPFFNFFSYKKNNKNELQKISFTLVSVIFAAAIFAQCCLIFSFLISDYSVSNVYQNSHVLKPLIYKIAGSWGNHEGSMLLLISILCFYTFCFNFFSKIDVQKKLIITSSQTAIIALFAAFTAFTSNPFARIFPIPTSGLGLNPLLQDIGLALHPPMLYTGYIGFSLIFSFAIAGLLTEKIDRDFALHLKKWLFFAYGFLTLGIGLGSWWAYRELGWGGYWFWDPVENVSLMPWLAATTLVHCLRLLEKKEIFKIWTAFLAILTFILCLIGIFLVRSGVLTSVHSFAVDAKRGFFVIGLILTIGGSALLIWGDKMLKIKSKKTDLSLQITAILFNNYVLLAALFIVFLGTIYPIFSRSFFDQFISIGPNYYNKIFSILIIPFLIFFSISVDTNQQKINFLNLRNALISLVTIAITSLTSFYHQQTSFLQILILFLAIFSALKMFLLKQNFTMKFAHLGFSLIIIGIILTSSFGITKEINLQQNAELEIGDYRLKFNDVKYREGKNFLARQGDFTIFKRDREIGKLSPQLRYYPISQQSTNEASIRHGIFGDLYLVMGTKDEFENYAIRAYYKPFIWLIWFGCAMIFSALICSQFTKKKNEK
jgi:cytochrome c-type biogenesis protein CcmF